MQNVPISRCFVTFCKQRQRNEQRIITHACTAIVLVPVAVEVCLIKLPKTEFKRQNNEQPNERKTCRTKGRLRALV